MQAYEMTNISEVNVNNIGLSPILDKGQLNYSENKEFGLKNSNLAAYTTSNGHINAGKHYDKRENAKFLKIISKQSTKRNTKQFFFDNNININKIIEMGPYLSNDIEYSKTLFYLIGLMLPGITKLELKDFYDPKPENIVEIKRLRKLLIFKALILRIEGQHAANDLNIEKHEDALKKLLTETVNEYRITLSTLYDSRSELLRNMSILKANFGKYMYLQNQNEDEG
ncbi:hypothetical protein COBT_002097 [Conglomerata obtusa]